MRLVNTSTLEIEEFSDGEAPPYAILSHTWGSDKEEVSLQEMKIADPQGHLQTKPGFMKIQKTCQIARELYGLNYAWVDTCTIDKTSSAELSEAINSMFAWYRAAKVCFVFFADLKWSSTAAFTANMVNMKKCRWFTRGWTLQELIAPSDIVFYDCNWQRIGCKSDDDLQRAIGEICGIHFRALSAQEELSSFPVAVRMSWASQRVTKRSEDRAYSLLGIFDVSMPLLYGEGGEKAFIRLQEEIMKENPDLSIFAWFSDTSTVEYMGMLATSPALFSKMGSIIPDTSFDVHTPEFSITNRGIRFTTLTTMENKGRYLIMPLFHSWDNFVPLNIYLRQIGPDTFVRARAESQIVPLNENRQLQSFRAVKNLSSKQSERIEKASLQLQLSPLDDFGNFIAEPRGAYNPAAYTLVPGQNGKFLGYIEFVPAWAGEFDSFVVVFQCFDMDPDIWWYVIIQGDDWKTAKDGYHERYSRWGKMSHPRKEQTLILRHLFDEVAVKVVRAKLETRASISPPTLALEISDS